MIQTITVTNKGISKQVVFTQGSNSTIMTVAGARLYLACSIVDPKLIGFLKGKIEFSTENLDNLIAAFSEETVSNTSTENKSKGFKMNTIKETITSTFNRVMSNETVKTVKEFITDVSVELYEQAMANKLFTALMIAGTALLVCATPIPMVLTLVSGVSMDVVVMTVGSYLCIVGGIYCYAMAAILK